MPPWPRPVAKDRLLLDAADRLGWPTTRVPLLINTQPRDGRAACVRCGFCVGFPCPVDAKNGSDVTALPKAIRLGAQLLAGTQVVRISDDGRVDVVVGGEHRTILAGRIVLAAGAIETARLLQVSRIGNDWVGDCLQGHTYAGAFGRFDDVVVDGLGPGPSVATRQFSHHNDGVVGGGLLANDFVKLPALFYVRALPPDAPRHGQAASREVSAGIGVPATSGAPSRKCPPGPRASDCHPVDRQRLGVPVARLEGSQHSEDLRHRSCSPPRRRRGSKGSGRAADLAVPTPGPGPVRRTAPGRHRPHGRDARAGATDTERPGLGHRAHLRGRCQPPRHQRRREPGPDHYGDRLADRGVDGGERMSTRWGIAGTGGIATRFADDLSLVDDAELVAVASRSRERADAFADRYGVARRHGDYADLAADPGVDVVYVATPSARHESDTLLFLEAGKHVLCEKPFALNAGQAQRMVAAARDRWVVSHGCDVEPVPALVSVPHQPHQRGTNR